MGTFLYGRLNCAVCVTITYTSLQVQSIARQYTDCVQILVTLVDYLLAFFLKFHSPISEYLTGINVLGTSCITLFCK